MINNEIIEFVECNKDNLKFNVKIKSKALYTSFIMIKFIL